MIPENLLEVRTHEGPDYMPLIDYQSWRVALMNHTPDLAAERIRRMQKHTETDEVFVLLAGRCILFLGGNGEGVGKVQAVDMQPFMLYNIKRGTWHSHTFSPEARVLIVENRETVEANSPFAPLDADQRAEVVRLTGELWGSTPR